MKTSRASSTSQDRAQPVYKLRQQLTGLTPVEVPRMNDERARELTRIRREVWTKTSFGTGRKKAGSRQATESLFEPPGQQMRLF
jgi:hypothetical protein